VFFLSKCFDNILYRQKANHSEIQSKKVDEETPVVNIKTMFEGFRKQNKSFTHFCTFSVILVFAKNFEKFGKLFLVLVLLIKLEKQCKIFS